MRFLRMFFIAIYIALIVSALVANGEMKRLEVPVSFAQVVSIGGRCTGFIGREGIVITARHCVEDSFGNVVDDPQKVIFYDNQESLFTVAIAGKNGDVYDFALLKGDTRGIKPVKLGEKSPPPYQKCVFATYRGGKQAAVPCTTAPTTSNNEGYIGLSAVVWRGDSGSPLVGENDKVFGIVTNTIYYFPEYPETPYGYGVRIEHINEALNKLK